MTDGKGYLTTHVLDTARGIPAAGLAIALYRLEGTARVLLSERVTNSDGRTDTPILPQGEFAVGTYELVFQAGAYLARAGGAKDGGFLGEVPVQFKIDDAAAHYHVPLLLSPFAYSTYRGS